MAGDFNLDYLTIKPADWNRLYNTAANNGFTLALDQRRGNDWPTMLKRRRQTTPTNYLKNQGLDNVAIRSGGGVLPFTVNVFDRVNRTAPSMMYTPMAAIQAIPIPGCAIRSFSSTRTTTTWVPFLVSATTFPCTCSFNRIHH